MHCQLTGMGTVGNTVCSVQSVPQDKPCWHLLLLWEDTITQEVPTTKWQNTTGDKILSSWAITSQNGKFKGATCKKRPCTLSAKTRGKKKKKKVKTNLKKACQGKKKKSIYKGTTALLVGVGWNRILSSLASRKIAGWNMTMCLLTIK